MKLEGKNRKDVDKYYITLMITKIEVMLFENYFSVKG